MGRHVSRSMTYWLGLGAGALGGYALAQQAWAIWQLAGRDVRGELAAHANCAPKGLTYSETRETEHYVRQHTIEDGIERVVYVPKQRRSATPILMQHGMWHGAWCWQWWQELFAAWGWETHAHSLPGHGGSPVQRPIALCTLDYYLGFLAAEIARLPRRPVLVGHSMGGALTQWYLKYVGDDLAAAILVAPWVSHSMFGAGFLRLLGYDPLGVLRMMVTWDATPLKRPVPGSAARFLVGPGAVMPLADLWARLGPESALVLYQHNPPFWYPPREVKTAMLWVAGEDDPLLVEADQRRSAAHYQADYDVARGARHNVMMEHNFDKTAARIHEWLMGQGV